MQFVWLDFKALLLKVNNKVVQNLLFMILGWFFTKFMIFMQMRNQRWPPPKDIVTRWTLLGNK